MEVKSMSNIKRLLLVSITAALAHVAPLAAQTETSAERQLKQAQAQLAQAQAEEARQQLQTSRLEAEKAFRDAVARKEIIQKIIEVKNANVRDMEDLFRNWAELRASPEFKLLTATGAPESVARLEAAIRELDGKLKGHKETGGVELMGYLIGASRSASGTPMSPAVEAVVKQLQANFPYQGYTLLETVTARAQFGPQQIQLNGLFPAGTFNEKGAATYTLRVRARRTSGEAGSRSIALEQLQLFLRVPISEGEGRFSFSDAGIDIGEIGIPEGKMVVVGKAGTSGPVEGVFLVLKAQVVD
jgi:hypothetical protein